MKWLVPMCLIACGSGDLLDRVNGLENEEVRLLEEREAMESEVKRLERRVERGPRPRRTRTARTPVERPDIDGVEEVDDTTLKVPRAGLRALLDDDGLARLARVIPRLEDGEPNGYKLYGIRRNSAASTLGFKNGDSVLTVNDTALTDRPSRDWAEALLEGERITIAGSRRGAPLLLVWELSE